VQRWIGSTRLTISTCSARWAYPAGQGGSTLSRATRQVCQGGMCRKPRSLKNLGDPSSYHRSRSPSGRCRSAHGGESLHSLQMAGAPMVRPNAGSRRACANSNTRRFTRTPISAQPICCTRCTTIASLNYYPLQPTSVTREQCGWVTHLGRSASLSQRSDRAIRPLRWAYDDRDCQPCRAACARSPAGRCEKMTSDAANPAEIMPSGRRRPSMVLHRKIGCPSDRPQSSSREPRHG